jgi:hypothetical protein
MCRLQAAHCDQKTGSRQRLRQVSVADTDAGVGKFFTPSRAAMQKGTALQDSLATVRTAAAWKRTDTRHNDIVFFLMSRGAKAD